MSLRKDCPLVYFIFRHVQLKSNRKCFSCSCLSVVYNLQVGISCCHGAAGLLHFTVRLNEIWTQVGVWFAPCLVYVICEHAHQLSGWSSVVWFWYESLGERLLQWVINQSSPCGENSPTSQQSWSPWGDTRGHETISVVTNRS